ncbi:MAG: hypothetical protein ABI351_07655 [Herbaspirillum sp.]
MKIRLSNVWGTVAIALGLTVPGVSIAQASSTQTSEYLAASTVFSANTAGSTLGEITPATPVVVIQKNGDSAEIAIEGWSMQGAKQYVFANIGQRIILATLDESGQAARVVEKSQPDRYGTIWDKVKITGHIPAASLVSNQDTVWRSASAIFQTHCSSCHALHDPHEFTANQWPSILKVMGGRAALNPADTELVTKYLQLHAKVPGVGLDPSHGSGSGAGKGTTSTRR